MSANFKEAQEKIKLIIKNGKKKGTFAKIKGDVTEQAKKENGKKWDDPDDIVSFRSWVNDILKRTEQEMNKTKKATSKG